MSDSYQITEHLIHQLLRPVINLETQHTIEQTIDLSAKLIEKKTLEQTQDLLNLYITLYNYNQGIATRDNIYRDIANNYKRKIDNTIALIDKLKKIINE